MTSGFPNNDIKQWQEAFIKEYLSELPKQATLVANPGMGKTSTAIKLYDTISRSLKYENLAIFSSTVLSKQIDRNLSRLTSEYHNRTFFFKQSGFA